MSELNELRDKDRLLSYKFIDNFFYPIRFSLSHFIVEIIIADIIPILKQLKDELVESQCIERMRSLRMLAEPKS